jgi:hypothetical protein
MHGCCLPSPRMNYLSWILNVVFVCSSLVLLVKLRMNEIFIFFINSYQAENFVVCYFVYSIVYLFFFALLEQYSLSHELRFQYINHADAIRVPKIDDVKEMRHTLVCHSLIFLIGKYFFSIACNGYHGSFERRSI